mgnify:CR=1 FL=1
MTPDEAQRRLARVCLDPTPSDDDLRALGATPERWHLYRALVRGRMVDTLGDALPRTRDALGAARFEAATGAFLHRAPPDTRYVRELCIRFADFLEGAPDVLADAAPWALDMARFEAAVMRCHIALDPRPDDPAVVDFDMARAPALTPAQHFLRVSWSVHAQGAIPEPGALGLLLYRDPANDRVETLVLTPIAADIYERLARADASVTDCVRAALAQHDAVAGQVFVERFADFLGDLMDRRVLLGGLGP